MPHSNSSAYHNLQRISMLKDQSAREALTIYRPQPQQLPVHLSTAKEIIVRGGKRSGKTSCCAIEFASRVLGEPITAPDGSIIPRKYPVSSKSDPCLYWIIGWDTKHIGQTIYKKLFEPGLFRIIKDLTTKQWRVWNEADPDDKARKAESKPAEPVIPPRFIDQTSWVWEAANAKTFESVKLLNGATICAYFSSARNAKQGDAVDGIWIDEDIQNPGHLQEWQDRLTDRGGWLMWSAWPHNKNPALISLLQRAEAEAREPSKKTRIESFQLVMTDNQYISEDNKADSIARMETDEDVARRDRGELMTDQLSMYDYNPVVHLAKKGSGTVSRGPKHVIEKLLTNNNRLPVEWPRYIGMDPSHVRTAIQIATVPPPEWEGEFLGDLLIIERELVCRRMSADEIAVTVAQAVAGVYLEAMVIDQNAGKQTHAGRDDSTVDLFSKAFAKARVEARTGKHEFILGCNKPARRFAAVRNFLQTDQFGNAKILFVADATHNTQREFVRYTKKFEEIDGRMEILDEPANPRIFDCMAALEYLVTYLAERFDAGNAYVKPESYKPEGSPSYRAWIEFQKKQQATNDRDYTHLGPGAAA